MSQNANPQAAQDEESAADALPSGTSRPFGHAFGHPFGGSLAEAAAPSMAATHSPALPASQYE